MTRRGQLPTRCLNISVKVLSDKPIIHDNQQIYSWELDVTYSFTEVQGKSVWRDLPLLNETLFVRNNESLQDAIDAASEGSIILVYPGSYKENLHINKAVKIFSSGGCTNTHIFGDVSVTADDVTLQGITFYPSTESFSTLKIYNSFTTIVNCRFVENLESTALYSPVPSMAIDCESCPHLHIVNNDFYGWKHAVLVKTTDSLVIQTNTFRFCHSAVLILTEGACNVWGNLFKNNIIGIQSPIMALTEKFLNNNDFSGNVIPLLGNGSFVSYPPLHPKYSEPVQTSNIFYVTGECNVENTSLPPYENCAKFETSECSYVLCMCL